MCRAEFWSLTRKAHPLQAPLKIYIGETVYLTQERQAVAQHLDLRPDPPSDIDLLSLGAVSDGQSTLLEYYPLLVQNRSGFHNPPGEPSGAIWQPPSARLYFDAQPFIRFRGIELSDEELYAFEALEE